MVLKNRLLTYVPLLVVMLLLIPSCRRGRHVGSDDEIVVQVGDSALLLSDVVRDVPRGISSDDSVRLTRAIIEGWLRRQVLINVAERNLEDFENIDRMVERYREDLILNRYLMMMDSHDRHRVDQKRVDMYYKLHKDSMVLDEPVVKGIFLKVREDDSDLDKLRGWMQKGDENSIDNLEKSGLRSATQYSYFKDRWYPWHEVAELVPYRFFDADAFLESTHDFETTYGGSVYLLHITDYVESGEGMPEDYAKDIIEGILRQEAISTRRQELVSEIYSHAIEEGILKRGLYDPVTGRMSMAESEH